jgi:putative DNA primase/helicase
VSDKVHDRRSYGRTGVDDNVGENGPVVSPWNARRPNFNHPAFGTPTGVWPYKNGFGEVLFYIARYDAPHGRKQFIPYTFHADAAGGEWRRKSWPKPRALFNSDKLAAHPDAPVLVVEGEKAAVGLDGNGGAAALFPSNVCVTSAGGAGAAHTTDWSPLLGHDVVIWPDADEPGSRYARDVARLALAAGARSVRIVNVSDLPNGFDLGDEIPASLKVQGRVESACEWPPHVPLIRVVVGELPRVVDEAEIALLQSRQPIFRRAGMLVRPIVDCMPAANGRMTTVARLRAMCVDSIADCMASAAIFQRLGRKQEWVNSDPPQRAAKTLLVREGKWRLPPITGVVTTPTLRSDGSLLNRPGYDAATRLFLVPDQELRLPAAIMPSREEAEDALALLRALLSGFPFARAMDEAVALSGLMTCVLRGTMSVAPLHAMRASTPGTGKTLLVDVAACISTGRLCPVITPGKSEEEMEKRLGALEVGEQHLDLLPLAA